MKATKYKLIVLDNSVKIYIDGILHLVIKQNELVGIQSWVNGDDHQKFYIEYYTNTKNILTEFDAFEKWKTILELLDKNNLVGIPFQ